MAKFKVGDKVEIISKSLGCSLINSSINQDGKGKGYITQIYGDGSGRDSDNCILVDKIKDSITGDYFAPKDLINLTNKIIMNKLTSKIRRFFTPALQKQYKAGLVDDCGNLTDKGREELDLILREVHEAELVKVAEAIIKEAKEDK